MFIIVHRFRTASHRFSFNGGHFGQVDDVLRWGCLGRIPDEPGSSRFLYTARHSKVSPSSFCLLLSESDRFSSMFTVFACIFGRFFRPVVVLAPQKFALLFTLGRGSMHGWPLQGSLCFLGSFSALRGHAAFLRPAFQGSGACWEAPAVPEPFDLHSELRHLHGGNALGLLDSEAPEAV